MTPRRNTLWAGVVVISLLLAAGCGKSDDQRKFEEQAYSAPEGITRTTEDVQQDPETEDPDDWRISPMYRGIIQFETLPHPNPVVRNSILEFDLFVSGIESVTGLFIYIYNPSDGRLRVIREVPESLPDGINNIRIDTSIFPTFSPDNLYRIIMFDGRDNVISYGDIEIQ